MTIARRIFALLSTLTIVATPLSIVGAGATAHAKGKLTVAVMEFDNASTDPAMAPLGKGLQAMLTTDLQQIGSFQLVERARLADLKAELKLGQSRAVNRKTAAKIGKMVGATHLVTGAFTVLGDTMRIDARMVAVASGKVLMTGAVSGTKEGFFEIQKKLARQLVASTGVTTSAKERYRLGKVQTADFQAFVKFSQGLTFFDGKRYSKAVAAMRAASTIDSDFALAKMTLEHYERAVSQTQTKADAAQVAERELAVLQQDKKAAVQTSLIQWLFAVSKSKSRKTSPQARMMALNILYDLYRGTWGKTFSERMRATVDNFAMARTSDALYATYYQQARKWVGKVPPFITAKAYGKPPTKPDTKQFKAMMTQAAARMYTPRAVNSWAKSVDGFKGTALHMSALQEAREEERLHQLAPRYAKAHCEVQHYKRPSCVKEAELARLKDLGESFRRAGDFDTSTRYFMRASAKHSDAKALKDLAREVKRNSDAVKALAGVPQAMKPLAQSLIFTGRNAWSRFPKLFATGSLDGRVSSRFRSAHRWPSRRFFGGDYVLIGGHPTWAVRNESSLSTGIRTDLRSADAVYYWKRLIRASDRGRRAPKAAPRSVLIYGANNRAETFKVGFTVEREIPALWAPSMSSYDKERWAEANDSQRFAATSFLFGVRDVNTPGVSAATNTPAIKPTPMTGWGVRFVAGEVVLFRFTQVIEDKALGGRVNYYRRNDHRETVLKRWSAAAVRKRRFKAKVSLMGGRLSVSVDGQRFSFSLPNVEGGFTGFEFKGTGFAGLSSVAKSVSNP